MEYRIFFMENTTFCKCKIYLEKNKTYFIES